MRGAMSKIFLEILDEPRQRVWRDLAIFEKDGYLAGGTALALQIRHRKSVDFDVFINKSVSNQFRLKVKKIFGTVTFSVDTSDQITFTTKNGVGITFVWYYYHLLHPPVSTSSLRLASVADIAADKAHTLGRRAVWRDYVDMFTLMKTGVITLSSIMASAKQKFAGNFVETQFLEQLSYFADVDVVPIDFIGEAPEPSEIKSFLGKQVEDYVKQIV